MASNYIIEKTKKIVGFVDGFGFGTWSWGHISNEDFFLSYILGISLKNTKAWESSCLSWIFFSGLALVMVLGKPLNLRQLSLLACILEGVNPHRIRMIYQ